MAAPTAVPIPELACYGLAGGARDPRRLIDECRAAEEVGLGTMFLSERFNVKELASLTGAAAAVTERLRIATGVTNHTTRHPLVTAAWASTMHHLSDGRFELGLGRGIDRLWDAMGMPRITTAQLADVADILRRLWHGDMIVGHDGPAGRYPFLHLDASFRLEIPLLVSAFGPNTLALGGRVFDGVILHTFFTDETLERCVTTVREAAERAGRDPATVRIWSCYLTVGDHLDDDTRLVRTVGRLATYLQGYGELLVHTNGWDPAVLQHFRDDSVVRQIRGAIDAVATSDQLEHIAGLLPGEWLAPAATGTAAECAAAVRRQLELGADGVIMHGATPDELAPVVAAWRAATPGHTHVGATP